MTSRPTSVDQLPLILTPTDVALVFKVSVKHVQNNPERFGLKKCAGKGLRVSRAIFCRKFGIEAAK